MDQCWHPAPSVGRSRNGPRAITVSELQSKKGLSRTASQCVLAVHEVLGDHDYTQARSELGRIEVPQARVAEDATLVMLHVGAPADSHLSHGAEAYPQPTARKPPRPAQTAPCSDGVELDIRRVDRADDPDIRSSPTSGNPPMGKDPDMPKRPRQLDLDRPPPSSPGGKKKTLASTRRRVLIIDYQSWLALTDKVARLADLRPS